MNVPSAQTRMPARAVPPRHYVYSDTQACWVPVVDTATADGVTAILVEGQDDPVVFHEDDDVDVCAPLRTARR